MDYFRLWHTIRMHLTKTAVKRAEYIRKHDLFYHMGEHCMTMFRKIPLYPKLISIGNNVWIASDVKLVTHDVIHKMLNNQNTGVKLQEYVGCIDIKDNVFIGTNSVILPNVTIGPNTVIGAGSLVNHDIPGNGVWGGVPAKYICSLDDFRKKRMAMPLIVIKRDKHGLSEDTTTACWNRFIDYRNLRETNK